MIRFRPNRQSMSASFKDEQTFSSLEDMLRHVHGDWSRVVAFMGGNPFRMDEITIGPGSFNPLTGYNDEHPVFVTRMADHSYRVPMCIGYCDLRA